jgi:sugar phosphate isomerase/epimerase
MTSPNRPLLGAALTLKDLAAHRDWLIARQRDLEIQDFTTAEVLDGDWRLLAEQVVRALDGHTGRRGLHGPFWGFKIDSDDPAVRAVVSRRLLQGLEVCEAVGADQMVVHSPFTTWDYNNLDNHPDARAKQFERVHQTLRAPLARAEAMGCTLVMENIEDKDPAARVALAASFNSAALRISIDTGHAHYAHVTTGAPPVDYYVNAAGAALRHVHLQDAEGYADRHWAPGEGTIRWAAVFRALTALEEMPRLILELRDHAQIPAGAAHLVGLGLAE